MIQIVSPGRFLLFCLSVFLLFLLVAGWVLWGSGRLHKTGDITVAAGETAGTIYRRLAAAGYLTRPLPWRYYIWRLKAANKLHVGNYHLQAGERVAQLIQRLMAGEVITKQTITYPEGFTVDQVTARTAANGVGTAADFMAEAVPEKYPQYPYLAALAKGRTLEGYLFPDTYDIQAGDTPRDVIQRLVANFDSKVTPQLRSEIERSGRTIDQVVIMASILEREVIRGEDMAVVSGILWKRFDQGIGLSADATIRYALKKWDGRLTADDLAVDSPYNTRRYRGLPPAPISNPGLRALLAAIRPTASDYYYYLSAPTGETVFAKTNDEHNANKAKYLK